MTITNGVMRDACEQYEQEIKRLQEDNRRLRVQLAETVKLAARYKTRAEQLEAARLALGGVTIHPGDDADRAL